MMILRQCVKLHGRLPQIVVVDGGPEFRSAYFDTLLARYECTKKTRPPAKARFGSICERLFGTTNMQLIHNLRGNTQITRNVRQVTKSVNPKGMATCRWHNVLTERSLSRSVRAWCPQCLEEELKLEGRNDHLLWTLSTVEVCSHHERRLETICPHCARQVRPLGDRSRPGHCSRCDEWLGYSESHEGRKIALFGSTELSYQCWVANQMGDLIAAAPGLPSDPPREKITEFIPSCIKLVNNGNVNAFVQLVGVNKYTVYSWLSKKPVPQTDLLLKVCYRLGLSLTDLLTKDQVFPDLELINHSLSQMGNITSRLRHKTGEVRRLLQAALEQDPPPSVREVAQHLGYKHVQFLHLRYPDLCKMLTARYRKASNGPIGLRPTELCAFLREVRRELGY